MSSVEVGIIVAAFSIILTALIAYNVRQSGEMRTMRDEITVLKTQVSPLWAQIQSRIASDLHHPHPRYFEMDKLLEKLEAMTITVEEKARLEILLEARAQDMSPDITEIQRKEASLMMQVIHLAMLEAKSGLAVVLAWIGLHLHFWK